MIYFASYLVVVGNNKIHGRNIIDVLDNIDMTDGKSLNDIEDTIRKIAFKNKPVQIILTNLTPFPHIKSTRLSKQDKIELDESTDFGEL